MKSYIYIVITKELFRQSIVGIERGSHGGGSAACPSPLRLIPPGAGLLWDYVPPRQLPGGHGSRRSLSRRGAGDGPGTRPIPAVAPSTLHPGGPSPPGGPIGPGSDPAAQGRSPSPTTIPPTQRDRAPVTPSLTNLPSAAGRVSPLPPCVKCKLKLYHFNKIN